MRLPLVIALLALPCIAALVLGGRQLLRALRRPQILPEELALAGAWVFAVGGLLWLGVHLRGASLLGFTAPWTWLAALHFFFAGFGALSLTALCCRATAHPRALKLLRALLLVHPAAYLITAAGIMGARACDEIGALGYALIFLCQGTAVWWGSPYRMPLAPMRLLRLSLAVPLFTMVPALAWAWNRPLFELPDMVRYHGIVNAIGHVGMGWLAFAWGRPPAQPPRPGKTTGREPCQSTAST